MIKLLDETTPRPWGDRFTVQEFKECVDSSFLVNYDGFGYFVTEDQKIWKNPIVIPSEVKDDFLDACRSSSITHVLWFNR